MQTKGVHRAQCIGAHTAHRVTHATLRKHNELSTAPTGGTIPVKRKPAINSRTNQPATSSKLRTPYGSSIADSGATGTRHTP